MKALTPFLFCFVLLGCDQSQSPCTVSVVKSYTNGTNLFVQLNNGQTLYAGETSTTHMYYNEEDQNSQVTDPTMSPPVLVNDSAQFRNNDLVGIWRLYSKGNGQNESLQRENYYLTIKSDGTFDLTNPDKHYGKWFNNSGWIEGKKFGLLNLMKYTREYTYNFEKSLNEYTNTPYGDSTFEPFIYYFNDVNGSKQLSLLNIGGKYGFEKLTYIKQ
jgi:hypothetical protein